MNIHMTSKHGSRSCTSYCDIGYVIKDHVKLLMQLLTNDLPQFNLKLQTTKCLNTAIMLMQFLLGDKGIKIANACDTRGVIARHTQGQEDNNVILTQLTKQLFSKREKSRTLYYILLSDGYFEKDLLSQAKYFPGHVFILEKIYDSDINDHIFFFYQSYINQYTLNEHIQMNKGLKVSKSRAQQLINDLTHVLTSKTWDKDNVRRWYDMTFADSSDLLNSKSQQKFFLCFRKAKTTTCLQRLEKYLKSKQQIMLSKVEEGKADEVYGDVALYDNTIKPLTNKQMLVSTQALLSKIKYNKTITQQ
jgi:hypothetical protein